MEKLRINLVFLLASLVIVLANLSTKQLLECRANLTTTIKNDTTFLEKVHQADYIFTGKIKELRKGQLHVRVKRAIKGLLNSTLDLALNDSCSVYIRRSYTGIFMGRRDFGFGNLQHVGKVVMHFGPVPLTLANLDRLNAAVRDMSYKPRHPIIEGKDPNLPSSNEEPCEKTFCAWGASCVVSETGRAQCQCPTECSSTSAPVCGSDDVTYTNHCHLRQASCLKRRNTRVKHQGACGPA